MISGREHFLLFRCTPHTKHTHTHTHILSFKEIDGKFSSASFHEADADRDVMCCEWKRTGGKGEGQCTFITWYTFSQVPKA